jgi:hypothetical protein
VCVRGGACTCMVARQTCSAACLLGISVRSSADYAVKLSRDEHLRRLLMSSGANSQHGHPNQLFVSSELLWG